MIHGFTVIVTCQGNPVYHEHQTLIGALISYAYQYLRKKKYGTMNFTLKDRLMR